MSLNQKGFMDFLETKRKSFYKLIEDYSCESARYPEEVFFLPSGTEGVEIDCQTIGLIPGIYGTEKYGEIVRRIERAKSDNVYLLLIAGRLISFDISKLEPIRSEGYPIFEDDADREEYFAAEHEEMIRRAMEDKENART
jgi:hypothetical protein